MSRLFIRFTKVSVLDSFTYCLASLSSRERCLKSPLRFPQWLLVRKKASSERNFSRRLSLSIHFSRSPDFTWNLPLFVIFTLIFILIKKRTLKLWQRSIYSRCLIHFQQICISWRQKTVQLSQIKYFSFLPIYCR